jgi:predicted  nucleic acid-binding Zn-ribbon protein
MSSGTAKPATPKRWDDVFTRVRVMLDETLAKADGRLEELDNLLSAKQNDRLARQLEGLEQRRQRANGVVEHNDQVLANGENSIREYLGTISSLRQKLVGWASRAEKEIEAIASRL